MRGIEIIGAPYVTQVELQEEEKREIYSRVYTTTPEKFRQATEQEIAEVVARREREAEEVLEL